MITSKLILTRYKKGVLSLILRDNQIQEIFYNTEDNSANIGDIFVAKVINVVTNIQAAFIDYQPGKRGYLPISSKYKPVLLNRIYDGRILAGDELLVQMEKEAIRTKEPVFTMNLSLPGKYCVVTNADSSKSVSSKLSRKEREILRSHILMNTEYGIVVRTNAK